MLGQLLKPEIEELIQNRSFRELRDILLEWNAPEIAQLIDLLPSVDDVVLFRLLPQQLAADTFEFLSREKQQKLVESLAQEKERLAALLNDLSPDDRTALFEELPGAVTQRLLNMLTSEERKVAITLLGYPEESIGRLMTTEYVAIRPGWTVQQALDYIRQFGKDSETLNVIYVVDESWRLIDDLRIRELLLVPSDSRIADLMDRRFVALPATADQETAVRVFRDYGRVALPVTDNKGVLLGIVTVDDVLVVAEEEATEDIHKIGGVESLETSYLRISWGQLVQKRSRWLVVLFLGEILTASAMQYFEDEIARAVVLALFVPLIISSGGNAGSQAATLIIRALAVGDVTLADWWRVMRRECLAGLALGSLLGAIGVVRVIAWHYAFGLYGAHWLLLGLTVGCGLLGVVLLGTLSGSLLPFMMIKLGADPAISSAPFVATLVDVTGLVIYFTVAALLLSGTLL